MHILEMMMPRDPVPPFPKGVNSQSPSRADAVDAKIGVMGPVEAETYSKDWRAAYQFRRHTEKVAAARAQDLILAKLEKDTVAAAEKALRDAGGAPKRKTGKTGFAALREAARRQQDLDDDDTSSHDWKSAVPVAASVAARLMFARLFDAEPEAKKAIETSAPVVVVDMPDTTVMDRLAGAWRDVLFDDGTALIAAGKVLADRQHQDAIYLEVHEPPKAKDRPAAQKEALRALSLALPFVAISPLGTTHLPEVLTKACSYRLVMPRIDAATIARTIRVVTGKPCRELLDADAVAKIGLDDLAVAVRFDRTPAACLAELRRLATEKEAKKKSRDLTLDQLHGMADAVAWAKDTIADLADWKAGSIGWDAVDNAVALTGPPGTGKSTFAKVFASEAGLPIILGSLAKWQASGEAHLGHLLRAMRQDFDAARAAAPSVMFVDEIDSFPDRAGVQHAHRDYVVEVVNALLEQVDGIAGREGVIVIGASNDLRRCDPALLRAGRLNRIVEIGLPDPVEIEKMLRVRLATDLRGEDLRDIAELAVGMTGADVERMVKDAKRKARRENRALALTDLRGALVEEDDRPPELKLRSCIHEASHIVVDVIHYGPDDVFATVAAVASRQGAVVRTKVAKRAGTYNEYRRRLEIILAGRVGEETILGAGSHGAGGEHGSDLDLATATAAAMTGSFGLTGASPLLYFGAAKDSRDFVVYQEIRDSVRKELDAAAASCRELLERNRGAVQAVADRLLAVGRIDGTEVARILAVQATPATDEAS